MRKWIFTFSLLIIILISIFYFGINKLKTAEKTITCIDGKINNSTIFCLLNEPQLTQNIDKVKVLISLGRPSLPLDEIEDTLVLFTSLDSSNVLTNVKALKRENQDTEIFYLNVSGVKYLNITLYGDLPHVKNDIFYKNSWITPKNYFVLVELNCNKEGCKDYEIYK